MQTETKDYFADLGFENGVSSCCGAKVYRDRGICADCGEHCSVEDNSKVIYKGHE